MLTHYTVIAVRRYLVWRAIATRTIIALFGIWCEGWSLFMCGGRSLFHFRRSIIRNKKGRSLFYFRRSVIRKKEGRSQSVQSSH